MSFLAWVLIIKITVSSVTLVIPFLLLPAPALSRFLQVDVSIPMARLYGVAIVALLVGYGFALQSVLQGGYPTGILWMGLVSNAGGAWVAAMYLTDLPRILGAVVFGGIALALAASLMWPQLGTAS